MESGLGGPNEPTAQRGETRPSMEVSFRAIDNINLWLWFELENPPEKDEVEGLEEVIRCWFMLGKLGSYDALNLFAHNRESSLAGTSYSPSPISSADASSSGLISTTACFHQLGELQVKGRWLRVWVDIGSADSIAFDMLVNALRGFHDKFCTIRQVFIGGTNDDWPIDPRKDIPDGAVAIDDFEIAKLQRLVAKMKGEMGEMGEMGDGRDAPSVAASPSSSWTGRTDATSRGDITGAGPRAGGIGDLQSLDDILKSFDGPDADGGAD